jgi:hypothetical protein
MTAARVKAEQMIAKRFLVRGPQAPDFNRGWCGFVHNRPRRFVPALHPNPIIVHRNMDFQSGMMAQRATFARRAPIEAALREARGFNQSATSV